MLGDLPEAAILRVLIHDNLCNGQLRLDVVILCVNEQLCRFVARVDGKEFCFAGTH